MKQSEIEVNTHADLFARQEELGDFVINEMSQWPGQSQRLMIANTQQFMSEFGMTESVALISAYNLVYGLTPTPN